MPPEAPSCRRAQSARPRARFCRRSVSLLLVLAALAAARGATAEVDDYDARRSSPENRTEQLGSAVSTRQRSGADTQVTEQSARNAAGERAAAVEGLSQDAAGEANDAGKRERKKKKGRNLDAATQDPQAPPGLDEVSTAPLVSAELSGPTPASSATGGGEEENLPGEENGDRAEGESRVSNAARDIRNGELGLQDNPTLYSDVQLVDALPNQSTDTSSSLAVNTGPDPGLGQGSPMYESLRNRKAQAKIKDASGKDLGAISFEWCHNTEQRFGLNTAINVLVAVDLPSCSFLWSGDSHAGESNGTNCAYQISSGHIEGPATGETCSSVSEVYDPMKAAVQRQRARQDEPGLILEELFGVLTDRCDSTFNSDKLTSCPAGSLSRQHGTGNMYFDYNLGIHNDIVGRSLLLAKSISGSPDYSLHCSPITFWDNCATSEKKALLDLKFSSINSDQLASWTVRGDMCKDFEGVTCDDEGHVVTVKLPYEGNAAHGSNSTKAPPLSLPRSHGPPAVPGSSTAALAAGVADPRPLQGTIPRNIGDLERLQILDLSGQELSGTLPASLDGAAELLELDLSGNQISGSIPDSWTNLKQLQALHLEANALTGTVPDGIFAMPELRNFSAGGNEDLCGNFRINQTSISVSLQPCDDDTPPLPLPPAGLPFPPPPPGLPPPSPPPPRAPVMPLLLGSIIPALLLLSLSISCCTCVMFRRKRRLSHTNLEGGPPGTVKLPPFLTPDPKGSIGKLSGHHSSVPGSDTKIDVFAGVKSSVIGPSRTGSPVTVRGSVAGMDAVSPSYNSPVPVRTAGGTPLPQTPALKTRCPSGYSPLDFAGLPPEVEADSERILGSGGYGVVYYADYTPPGGEPLPAAVKVISNSDYDESHASKFKTFKDEVEMLSLFGGNDCIVQIYTYCLDFPRAFIVYEYLPGDTLARYIHGRDMRLSYLQILQIGYGIAEGLHALHLQHVVHRDLKPDNILLDAHTRPKLTDFGISRRKDAAVSAMSTQNLGTWSYMAPEQFNGRVSEKSDIYSLGLILWECWTTRRPWDIADDRDVWGVVYTILHEEKRPEIPSDCPRNLRALLEDCWSGEPKNRPSALELKSRIWKMMTLQSRRRPPTTPQPQQPAGERSSAQTTQDESSSSGQEDRALLANREPASTTDEETAKTPQRESDLSSLEVSTPAGATDGPKTPPTSWPVLVGLEDSDNKNRKRPGASTASDVTPKIRSSPVAEIL